MEYWIIGGVALAVLARAMKAIFEGFSHPDDPYCTTCGSQGRSRTHTRGHLGIELILWLCLIVPGLLYSIWRLASRNEVCSQCGAATLVPADSPVAIKMRKDLSAP